MANNMKELESHSPLGTEELLNDHPERPGSPVSRCSICLDELTNKCRSESCSHLFCFECLKQWTVIKATCPLCLVDVKKIFHSFNDKGLHETYEVPEEIPSESLDFDADVDVEIIEDSDSEEIASDSNSGSYLSLLRQSNQNLVMRIEVYSTNIWAQPFRSLEHGLEDYCINYWRDHYDEIYRLITFLVREIFIVRTKILCDTTGMTNEALTYILLKRLMYSNILCSHAMFDFLVPYFGPHTAHFCHELYTFASSRLILEDFDENVRYPMRRPSVGHVSNIVEWLPLSHVVSNVNSNDTLELLFESMFETIDWDYRQENSFHWLPTYEGFCNQIPCDCINQALGRINTWAVQTATWARIQNCLNQLRSIVG